MYRVEEKYLVSFDFSVLLLCYESLKSKIIEYGQLVYAGLYMQNALKRVREIFFGIFFIKTKKFYKRTIQKYQ